MRILHATQACRRSGRGFTLIELILVMAVLLVVFGVTFPSLKGFFRGRSLDSEARRFLSLTRYAQSRAVSEGLPMVLWIDVQNGAYGLQTATGYSLIDSNAVEFEMDQELEVEVSTSPVRTSSANQFVPRALRLGDAPRNAINLRTIRFLPEGFIDSTSPEGVALREGDDYTIWIAQSQNRLNYEIQTNQPPAFRR